VSAAQKVAKIVECAEVSPEVQARLNRSIEQANLEAIQVCYAVCKAFVAQALGAEPSTNQVNEYMAKAVEDPAFPNRAYRLFGEAQKSASRRRRIFLASMLFGPPFSKMPDDERDRVDMAVERMTVEDAELLMAILDNIRTPQDLGHDSFGPTGVLVLTPVDLERARPEKIYIVTPDLRGRGDEVRMSFPRGVFESLKLLGCVETGTGISTEGSWARYHLLLTDLGGTVGRAIKEVRPGLVAETVAPASPASAAKARRRR
jgi:hypothetical protein